MKLKKSCILYIVRHGETEWNQKNLVQGHTDIPLAEEGHKQALARAEFFREVAFGYVASSDLQRAKQTAAILSEGRNLPLHTSEKLREQSWGAWEGHSFDKLREKFGARFNAYSGDKPHAISGVESHREIAARVNPYLLEIAGENPDQNILVVSHGGVLKGLIFHFGIENLFNLAFENLGFIKIEYDGKDLKFLEAQGMKEHVLSAKI
ncbi:MAG TPA: histidine phosphatase family protein [Parachlamydiaceae bacterium]|nr:histidine phosphatase family protein [Parachlamydiaceae bacterium]